MSRKKSPLYHCYVSPYTKANVGISVVLKQLHSQLVLNYFDKYLFWPLSEQKCQTISAPSSCSVKRWLLFFVKLHCLLITSGWTKDMSAMSSWVVKKYDYFPTFNRLDDWILIEDVTDRSVNTEGIWWVRGLLFSLKTLLQSLIHTWVFASPSKCFEVLLWAQERICVKNSEDAFHVYSTKTF